MVRGIEGPNPDGTTVEYGLFCVEDQVCSHDVVECLVSQHVLSLVSVEAKVYHLSFDPGINVITGWLAIGPEVVFLTHV